MSERAIETKIDIYERKKLCVATVTKEMCHHIYFRHGINSFLAFNIYSVDS